MGFQDFWERVITVNIYFFCFYVNIHSDYPVLFPSLYFGYTGEQITCIFNWKFFDSREALTASNLYPKILGFDPIFTSTKDIWMLWGGSECIFSCRMEMNTMVGYITGLPSFIPFPHLPCFLEPLSLGLAMWHTFANLIWTFVTFHTSEHRFNCSWVT